MTDFFDRVEQELTGAAERLEARAAGDASVGHAADPTSPAKRRGRLAAWFASHSLLGLAAGAVLVGGAGATTAAVVAHIHGTPSPPTHGTVSVPVRGPQGHQRSEFHYRLTMTPGLWVGHISWCETLEERFGKTGYLGASSGCGYAAYAGQHTFGGSTTYLGPGRGLIGTLIVDDAVGYVQLTSGKKIVPISDPALPNGWRAVVLLPGESHDGKMHLRTPAGKPFGADQYRASADDFTEPLPAAASNTLAAENAACAMSLPAPASPRRSVWLPKVQSTPNLAGYAFLPCAQTDWRADDQWVETTVVLDAADPGTAMPAVLSGSTRSPTNPNVVEFPADGFPLASSTQRLDNPGINLRSVIPAGRVASARRFGNAWVVVRAKSRALRERVLREISVRAPGS